MQVSATRSLIAVLLTGLTLATTGCEEGPGTPPDVAAGRYTARISGGLVDTLSGPARYRMRNERLVGLELGAKEGPGLSIELTPDPPALRTYDLVGTTVFRARSPDSLARAMAFLRLGKTQLRATRGSLKIGYVGEALIGGRFDLAMEGYARGAADTPVSVRVTGTLNAKPIGE